MGQEESNRADILKSCLSRPLSFYFTPHPPPLSLSISPSFFSLSLSFFFYLFISLSAPFLSLAPSASASLCISLYPFLAVCLSMSVCFSLSYIFFLFFSCNSLLSLVEERKYQIKILFCYSLRLLVLIHNNLVYD